PLRQIAAETPGNRGLPKILHALPGGSATGTVDGDPAAPPALVGTDSRSRAGEIHAQRLTGVHPDVGFPVTDDDPAVQPFQGWPLRVELQDSVIDVVIHLQSALLGTASRQNGPTIDQAAV